MRIQKQRYMHLPIHYLIKQHQPKNQLKSIEINDKTLKNFVGMLLNYNEEQMINEYTKDLILQILKKYESIDISLACLTTLIQKKSIGYEDFPEVWDT